MISGLLLQHWPLALLSLREILIFNPLIAC